MNTTNEESFDKLLSLIDEATNMLDRLKTINETLEEMQGNSEVGRRVPFGMNYTMLFDAIDNLEDFLRIKGQVEKAKEDFSLIDTFEIGDIAKAKVDIRIGGRQEMHYSNARLDVTGYVRYSKDKTFSIIDFDGVDYVLEDFTNNYLLFVDKGLMNTFFNKTEEKETRSFLRVDFLFTGIKKKYLKNLSSIRLFSEKARERTNNSWEFGQNYDDQTPLVKLTIDETFGNMCSVYFNEKLAQNYTDFILYFNDIFAVGFSQSKSNKDIYKYNGKISFYTKEKGKYGVHYFPKDVLYGTTSDRILTLLEVKQLN
ncbi:gp589 [Bacillus phage G]|uniref:Gp589 n=1 Tax=Bacillus phage G TaxID=2884420 RepID=G3MAW9_9CAUD|nr:gp589 [Bacillus phage G]AEO93834.1 gp589 [Bacillus phage G]